MRFLITFFVIAFIFSGCDNTSKINFETTINEPKVYGEFSTNITDKTPERLNNIQLAVNKLNGATVNPGETFSFNDYIGPRTKELGYQEAIIFDGHGNKTKGYGGGICQISSTLYNAVLNAGLKVIERHEHSHEVPYIEAGKDATVSYGADDFKFKNTNKRAIKINASTDDDILFITITQ